MVASSSKEKSYIFIFPNDWMKKAKENLSMMRIRWDDNPQES